ncbi:MAG: polyisoprenoid-binding protein [Nitrospiraceae bacterium]|nr:MAG: polyisoprenoid-binding protein [Nitrospiraceae bacterium]
MKKFMLILIAIAMALPVTAQSAVYDIDPEHSDFGFSVKHMVIANVKGTFQKIEGTLEFNDNNKLTAASAVIAAESIYTKIEKRDNHLRSPDFFDVAKYPNITFKTTSVEYSGPGKLTITGDITIRDVAREITLTGETLGPVKDPWGNTRMGFNASGTLNRKDFGLLWNKVLETGGLLVGDMVELIIEGEGILRQ